MQWWDTNQEPFALLEELWITEMKVTWSMDMLCILPSNINPVDSIANSINITENKTKVWASQKCWKRRLLLKPGSSTFVTSRAGIPFEGGKQNRSGFPKNGGLQLPLDVSCAGLIAK